MPTLAVDQCFRCGDWLASVRIEHGQCDECRAPDDYDAVSDLEDEINQKDDEIKSLERRLDSRDETIRRLTFELQTIRKLSGEKVAR